MAATKTHGPVVGIDIGTAFIKVVEMRPSRGAPHVGAIAIAPTPVNTFAGDVIQDPVGLGKYIKALMQESGIHAKTVVASLSGQTSFAIRPLHVPVMTDRELAESMKWEVERYVPFRPEETIRDFARLPKVGTGGDPSEMTVLLVAAQKQMVENYAYSLLGADLTPVALDVEPLSLLRALPLNEVKEHCIALVNLGASKTEIGVFDEGVLVYPRTVPIAGNNLTRTVADTLGLPTEQAERLKVEFGHIPEERSQAHYGFDVPGGYSPFEIPGEEGAPEATGALDFGGGAATVVEEPADEPVLGGFAAPLDEEGERGITFHMEEEEELPAAGSGGLSFTLEEETPSTGTPSYHQDGPAAGSVTEFEPEPGGAFTPPSESSFAPAPESVFDSTGPSPEGTGDASLAPVSESDRQRRRIGDSLVPVYNDLSVEIRRSLDYYANRPGGRAVERVYLTGGTARMKGLARALEEDLGVPVQLHDPSRLFPMSGKSAQPGYYAEVGPVITLAIGLAIRDMVPDAAPTVVSPKAAPKKTKEKAA